MPKINPYLNFNGNTEEAFNFYKSVFGGEFPTVMRFKDTAVAGDVVPEDQDKIMHIALPIGIGNMLMGTDTLESMGQKFTPGNNIHLSLSVDSREEADKIYKALSAGGKATMPLKDEFWGDYFGMLVDKFGISWMIAHSKNQQG